MFNTIFGLPFHPLIVHATVVIVPSAALAVGLAAVWPRLRRWAGFLPLLLSAAGVLLIPITTSSGEALEHRLPHSDLIEEHAHLADGLLLPAIVLLAGAAALYWVHLKEGAAVTESAPLVPAGSGSGPFLEPVTSRIAAAGPDGPPRALVAVAIALAVVGVLATTVQVARIGHSGAKAAWSDVAQQG